MFPSLSFLGSGGVKTNVCGCVALPCTLGSELPCLPARWLAIEWIVGQHHAGIRMLGHEGNQDWEIQKGFETWG